jgi:hypothetical protein
VSFTDLDQRREILSRFSLPKSMKHSVVLLSEKIFCLSKVFFFKKKKILSVTLSTPPPYSVAVYLNVTLGKDWLGHRSRETRIKLDFQYSSLLKHDIFFQFGPEPSSSDFPWCMVRPKIFYLRNT